MLILDEAHVAAPASATKHAVDSDRFDNRIFLSATPHSRKLEILWDLELGAKVIEPEAHGLGKPDDLDSPILRRLPARARVERSESRASRRHSGPASCCVRASVESSALRSRPCAGARPRRCAAGGARTPRCPGALVWLVPHMLAYIDPPQPLDGIGADDLQAFLGRHATFLPRDWVMLVRMAPPGRTMEAYPERARCRTRPSGSSPGAQRSSPTPGGGA